MLSLKTLLNPAPPGQDFSPSHPHQLSTSSPSTPAASTTTKTSIRTMDIRTVMPRHEDSRDSNSLAKSKVRGPVQFAPFESLDHAALQHIQRFRIRPYGNIHQSSTHIPYNSGKKDFHEKTGREGFEVFRYEFTAPDTNVDYAVMWDYNVGLVRMTPFFKCCQYGKTIPGKMLGLNPGLKDITHSITGGSIAAQGYWMPYICAKAVCATFCYNIAGALIPLFGAAFPSECIHPGSKDFAKMVINPGLVAAATRDADKARRMVVTMPKTIPHFGGATSCPRNDHSVAHSPHVAEERTRHFRPRIFCDPEWPGDHDRENHYMSAPNSASSTGSGLHGYMVASRSTSSWTPANNPSPNVLVDGYNPDHRLSAVPRIAPGQQYPTSLPALGWGPKRRLDCDDGGRSYRGSTSSGTRMSPAFMAATPDSSPARGRAHVEQPRHPDAAQKNAAILLLNLSMHDKDQSSSVVGSPVAGSLGMASPQSQAGDLHRNKRQRASSF